MIEYWSADGYGFPEEAVDFSIKMDTDLYALPKAKAMAQSLEISADGSQFAIWSSDRCSMVRCVLEAHAHGSARECSHMLEEIAHEYTLIRRHILLTFVTSSLV